MHSSCRDVGWRRHLRTGGGFDTAFVRYEAAYPHGDGGVEGKAGEEAEEDGGDEHLEKGAEDLVRCQGQWSGLGLRPGPGGRGQG